MTLALYDNHHSAKFGDHRHCGRGDIMVLVCYVILQNHMIRGSCKYKDETPLGKSISPAKFGGHTHCHSGDKMVLVCQMILHNHVIKGS